MTIYKMAGGILQYLVALRIVGQTPQQPNVKLLIHVHYLSISINKIGSWWDAFVLVSGEWEVYCYGRSLRTLVIWEKS